MRALAPDLRRRLALLSASGLTAPAIALAQGLPAENVLLQQSTGLPIAKTWYVDEDGNFVLITQQQLVELAQAPAPGIPLQALSSAGSEGVTIPASMFNQIVMYSAGIGGLAGGALVGGLILATSGDASSGVTVSSGSSSSGGSPLGGVTNATISVVDDAIDRGETGGEITYTLSDDEGIDESDLVSKLNFDLAGASTLASIFPTGAVVSTHDQTGLVSGTQDVYTGIGFTLTGDVATNLNLGTFPGPALTFTDGDGNAEVVNLQLNIADPGLPSLTLVVDGGATGSTVSGSIGDDTITINTMPNQGTVSALDGADTIHLYDVITWGETIDGGNGNDNLQLYTNVTAGSITNVERVDIRTTALVDMGRLAGANEINIETTNVVTFDNFDGRGIKASADAKVVIKGAAVGTPYLSARGNLTLESDDPSLSQLYVDMNGGSTLTLTADGTNDAITELTLDSTGDVTLVGAQVSELKEVYASGVNGTLTTSMSDAALTTYFGADGADNIHLADLLGTVTINLHGGNDVLTSAATAGTLIVDGGAGTDSFTLGSGAGATHIIKVNELSDLKITGLSDASALSAALAVGAFEVVTNFSSGTDEINIKDFGLSGISVVQTSVADVYTQLATDDVVILNENGADYDGDTEVDDNFVIVDTAGDRSAVAIFKIDSAAIVQSDIDLF